MKETKGNGNGYSWNVVAIYGYYEDADDCRNELKALDKGATNTTDYKVRRRANGRYVVLERDKKYRGLVAE